LPLPEIARLATQMANGGSRPGWPNHFLRTVSRVRFALPRSAISAAIFSNFSGMSVKPFDLLSAFIFRIHVMAPNEYFGKLPAEAMRREP